MNTLQSEVYENEFGLNRQEVDDLWCSIPEVFFGVAPQTKVNLRKVLFGILVCSKWGVPLSFSERLMALPRGVLLDTWSGNRHEVLQPHLPVKNSHRKLASSHKKKISSRAKLPAEIKNSVFILRQDGVSVKEIADNLGIGVSTVYSYLRMEKSSE